MVDLATAWLIHLDDTALIELEGGAAGVEDDRERLEHDSVLHLFDVAPDLPPFFDMPDDLRLDVLAVAWGAAAPRSVRVVLLEHGSVVLLKAPRVIHPCAIAAPTPVVSRTQAVSLAVKLLAARAHGKCAVDQVLLRNVTNILVICLQGECTLRRCVGGEGPAGAAAALVLHLVYVAVFRVVDGPQLIGQASASTRPQRGYKVVVVSGHVQHLKILLF